MPPQIITDFKDFPQGSATSVCLGNFDGIHLGHQEILRRCIDTAKRRGTVSVLFTFSPHPSRVVDQNRSIKLLLTPDEKQELLQMTRVNWILNQNFTSDFSQYEAKKFCESILIQTLNAKNITIGSNFHFGKGAKGRPELLKNFSFFEAEIIQPVATGDAVVSSSAIRLAIEEGRVEDAAQALGYSYFISGKVSRGDKRGRQIGFPTANLFTEKECLPKIGVYLTLTQDLSTQRIFASLTNVGRRPTIEANLPITFESHLIDFKDDLYDRPMRVFFVSRLRDEIQFKDLQALRQQILFDLQMSKTLFRRMKWMQSTQTNALLNLTRSDPMLLGLQPFEKIRLI